jgi:hypothetical protein
VLVARNRNHSKPVGKSGDLLSDVTLDLGSVVSGAGAHADGKVYYAGGSIGKKVSNAVQQIELLNNTLKTVASLPTPRVGLD